MGQVGGGIGGGGNSPFEAKADFNNRRNFSKNLANGTIRPSLLTCFLDCFGAGLVGIFFLFLPF